MVIRFGRPLYGNCDYEVRDGRTGHGGAGNGARGLCFRPYRGSAPPPTKCCAALWRDDGAGQLSKKKKKKKKK